MKDEGERGERDEKGRWAVGGGIWLMYNHWECLLKKPIAAPGGFHMKKEKRDCTARCEVMYRKMRPTPRAAESVIGSRLISSVLFQFIFVRASSLREQTRFHRPRHGRAEHQGARRIETWVTAVEIYAALAIKQTAISVNDGRSSKRWVAMRTV